MFRIRDIKVLISNWLLNSKISQLETLKLLEVLVKIGVVDKTAGGGSAELSDQAHIQIRNSSVLTTKEKK